MHMLIMCPERSFAGGLVLVGCTDRSQEPAGLLLAQGGRCCLFAARCAIAEREEWTPETSLGCQRCTEKDIRVSQRSQLEEGGRRL